MGAGEAPGRRCPAPRRARPADAPSSSLRRRAGDALVGAGFSEAIGWSFQAPEMARRLRLDAPAVVAAQPALRGPVGDAHDAARLAAGLACATTRARGAEDVRLFEEGAVYFDRPHGREPTAAEARSTPLPDEQMHLARADDRARCGPPRGATRRRRRADFFAAKGALETLLGALRVRRGRVVRGDDPFLHPGRAARVLVGGRGRGLARRAAPGRGRASGTSGRVAGFELDLGVVLPHADVVAAATRT